jgi:hypothetical protein
LFSTPRYIFDLELLQLVSSYAANEWHERNHAEDPYDAVDPSSLLALTDIADDTTGDPAADVSEAGSNGGLETNA